MILIANTKGDIYIPKKSQYSFTILLIIILFFSVNKIIIKINALTKIIATDNWIVKVSPYNLNLAHQSDASLSVSACDSHLYVPNRPEGSQCLTIDVKSTRPNVESFQIRYLTSKR